MSPAAAAILEGMPDPRDLRRGEHDGMTFICAGSALLACYPSGDAGMRNVAVAVLRQLGFGGRGGAAGVGLAEDYVAPLHNRALRGGAAGLVRGRGRPRKRAARGRGQAARARAGGAGGVLSSGYAGAMLACAYLDRIGAEAILAAALPPALARPRYDDLGVLTATSLAFALGVSSAEGTRHLIPGQAGILAGIGRLPDPRTLRPRLAAIAGRCDPLALQRQLAAAMLTADAPGLHVYYVDDHFVPYEGAQPVPKGWNTKRRHAQPD